MKRRDVLRSATAMAATGMFGTSRSHASPSQDASQAQPGQAGPYIQTGDGQSLWYKDWGSGSPIVFLAAWGLPSDMWDYQMVPLADRGLRCISASN